MGVEAVKASSSSWSCWNWLRRKASALSVAGAGGPARADGHKLAGVFEGFGAVEVGLGRAAAQGGK